MEKIELTVVCVGGKEKGIFKTEQMDSVKNKYWDSTYEVTVPLTDWKNEKINISNIRNYKGH